MPPSSSTTSTNTTTPSTQALALLLPLFGTRFSPAFLTSCIAYWAAQPPPTPSAGGRKRSLTAEELAARVAEKLLGEEGEGGGGGRREEVVAWVGQRRAGREGAGRQKEDRGKGKGKARQGFGSGEGEEGKREDLTLARNLALIRLHLLFPLVPILQLRILLLSLEHSFIYLGTEELLARSASTSSVTAKNRRLNNGRVEVVDLAEVGKSVLTALGRLFSPSSRSIDTTTAASTSAIAASLKPTDPVLTPHDLFHSPSFTCALTSHFTVLFPALPSAAVSRAVEQEGGSYASLRARLEVQAAEAAARSASEGGRGKWWSFLAPPSASSPSSSSLGGGEGGLTDVKREQQARELLLSSGSCAAVKALEAYEGAAVKQQRRPRLGRAASSVVSIEVPEADEQILEREGEGGECQCCFGELPFPSSANSTIFCSSPTSPSSSDDDDDNDDGGAREKERHSFCPDCLHAFVSTFTTGGTPLPPCALSSLSLPCFAASSSPSSTSSTCTGILTPSTLSRALSSQARRALEARSTAANLEVLVASSSSSSSNGERKEGVHLQRCPFCPYLELVSPPPHTSSGPLGRAFLPAWSAEAFPPSPGAVLRTLVGGVMVVLLAVVVGVVALLCPVPLPRLEKVYHDSVVNSAPSSSPPTPTPPIAAPPPALTLSTLPLSTLLLLSPHHLLPLSLVYLRLLAARVLRRKDGARAVFYCRNDGRGWRGERGGRGGEVERMMRVEEALREVLREEGGGEGEAEEVEEERRAAIVAFVWGEDDPAGAEDEADDLEAPQDKCGKPSCLLCLSALNPSCPSLHRCSSPSSSSGSGGEGGETEQHRLEESLRLAVEKAMSEAAGVQCGRCGAGVVKEGGCNKVTCRCGAAYCWSCRSPIPPSVGYRHFCQHFRPDPSRECTKCRNCHLYQETDEKGRVQRAGDAARQRWATSNPDWARKINLEGVVVGPPSGLSEGHPLTEDLISRFEKVVEAVVSMLYTPPVVV